MKSIHCPKCQMVINVSNHDILHDVSVYCENNHYYSARKLANHVKIKFDPIALINQYDEHQKFKRKCYWLDTAFSADNVTCLHTKNPTGINVCSHEHCPLK